ncbi:MAG TPA: Sir2 family NAD-dependent protein deacetylase [Acidimicrobiales bacterium]
MHDEAARWIRAADAVTVFTGAGISTASGIPDYRGPQGVWTRNPEAERMATLHHYLDDPDVRRASWRHRAESPVWAAEPNAAHRAIAEFERGGTLVAVVTQNVDGLHQRAGSDPSLVVELHGNMHWTRCWTCGDRRPMEEAVDRVRAGEDDPRCLVCGGILKSTTISFGENLDPAVLARGQDAADVAEVFIAAGSSLAVQPAASLVPRARRRGARLVIANQEPTPYDGLADAVLREPLADLLPALLGF